MIFRAMRLVPLLILLCFAASKTTGEQDFWDYGRLPDECGDPRQISQAYTVYESTVIEVVDGDTLVVETHGDWIESEAAIDGSPRSGITTVQLVCVDAPPTTEPIGIESRDRLSARLLGKKVAVLISPYQEKGAPLNVMISHQGGHPIDENVEQLEQGMARFRYFGPYAIDWWMRCHYERAEERAQKANRGVWAN